MQSKPTDTRYHAKGAWLMESDDEGATYLHLYRLPADAGRAARDLNRHGRADSPAEYERRRGLRG